MHWQHTITIDAPASAVWQLNIDVEQWPALTPTMQQVERLDDGPFGLGSKARIKQPGQSAAVWTVTHFVVGREFAWQTKRLGLTMTGSHRLEPVDGGCRNTLAIEVTGTGSKLFGLLFGSAIRKSIETENKGFQAKAAASPHR